MVARPRLREMLATGMISTDSLCEIDLRFHPDFKTMDLIASLYEDDFPGLDINDEK